ncbi:hypothetical protein AB0M02_21120 [Actinoplanes sp. NPDC051861]|uniref:hypothetical protein n=1 Tax=Actinoplanes sp. NPDC051861 TaxID=3155170 RepID=UPI00343307E9
MAVASWGLFWWLAFPRHEICALTFPAPAGCGAGRVPEATFWTVVTVALLGAAVFAPAARWRRLGGIGLFGAAVWGFFAVLYA